jgi:hypothetical protein
MRWYFIGLAVVLLLVLALLPAECCAKGLFSFFNPEVTTPVTAAPSNGSDIIGGMKATITLGSIGSVLTSHLALLVFGILLYAALKRVDGPAYQARLLAWRERKLTALVERWRLLYGDRANWRSTLFSILHPGVTKRRIKQDAMANTMTVDCRVHGLAELEASIAKMNEAAARMEAARGKGGGKR